MIKTPFHKSEFSMTPVLMTVFLYVSGLMVSATPLPLIYVYLRQGQKNFLKTAAMACLAVIAIYIFGIDFIYRQLQAHPDTGWLITLPAAPLLENFSKASVVILGVGYFVFFVILGFLISRILVFPIHIYSRSIRSVLGLYLLVVVGVAVYVLPQASEFLHHYNASIKELIRTLIAEIDQSADYDSVSVLYFKTALQHLGNHFLYFLPIFFFSSVSFLFVLNLIVAKRLFFPFRPELLLIRFTDFRLPFYFVWIAITSLSVLLINTKLLHIHLLTFLGLNVFIGVMIFYFYQGLSVFVSVLDAKNIRGLMRVMIYLLSIYLSLISVVLFVATGFFDSWVDVRKYLFPIARQ